MVANMLKPGIFQPDMRTTGLVLIMTLPGVLPALDMWDTLFPVGERFAQILSGKLTDENLQPIDIVSMYNGIELVTPSKQITATYIYLIAITDCSITPEGNPRTDVIPGQIIINLRIAG